MSSREGRERQMGELARKLARLQAAGTTSKEAVKEYLRDEGQLLSPRTETRGAESLFRGTNQILGAEAIGSLFARPQGDTTQPIAEPPIPEELLRMAIEYPADIVLLLDDTRSPASYCIASRILDGTAGRFSAEYDENCDGLDFMRSQTEELQWVAVPLQAPEAVKEAEQAMASEHEEHPSLPKLPPRQAAMAAYERAFPDHTITPVSARALIKALILSAAANDERRLQGWGAYVAEKGVTVGYSNGQTFEIRYDPAGVPEEHEEDIAAKTRLLATVKPKADQPE
ncbi:hypothetical protein MRY87_07020 [bacterium]|nr:hypothetical protein [bacterium]